MNQLAIPSQIISIKGIELDALSQQFEAYLRKRNRKAATIKTYFNAIKQFITYQNNQAISGNGAEILTRWRDFLQAKNLTTATIRLYLQAIKNLISWAAKQGYVSQCLAADVCDVNTPKIEPTFKKDCLSEYQGQQLLQGIDRTTLIGKRDYAIILLGLICGLRCCELSRAKIIDFRTSCGVTALFVYGKGHDTADVAVRVPFQVEAAIREYLQARGQADKADPLFVSCSNRNKKKNMTPKSTGRIIKEHLNKVTSPGQRISAHSLRHTTAFTALQHGTGIMEVKNMLRHKSINTTQIYADHLQFANRQLEQKLANIFCH